MMVAVREEVIGMMATITSIVKMMKRIVKTDNQDE